MMSSGGRRALLALLVAGCHANGDAEDVVSTVRVTPSSLSSPGSWGLFDRSLESGFVPDANVVRASLDHQEQLTAIKVYGAAPYRLRLTGRDGSSIGFPATDLSKLSPGWNIIPTSSLVSSDSVELRFESLGAGGKIPEIELWAVEEEPVGKVDVASSDLPRGFISLDPDTKSQDVAPADCATFSIDLERAPTSFRKLHLVYQGQGVFRSFSIQRSINGLAEQGGAWLAGDTSKRTFVEEIDPAVVHLGKNEIRMCLPSDASRGVSITNLHLVGELDRGKGLVSAASIGERARDGSALLDADPSTSVNIAASESLLLAFDRLTSPDAVELVGRGLDVSQPPSVSCNPLKGDAITFAAKARASSGGLVIQLDAATKQCAAITLLFPGAASLTAVDLVGSGASEPVDWARVVVTSPLEHFGDSAWVGGFVARPTVMSGAIRVDVADGRETAMTGDFGRLVKRTKDATGPWPVDVKATLPDGTTQKTTVTLDQDVRSQLASAKANPAVNTAKAAADTRFGEEGDVVVGRARKLEAISVRLGTSVGIDLPVGAVQKDTNVTVRHLGEDVLPPLDPGMINVTAPKGHGYEFLPHGQKFAKDVEVTVPYDASLIPAEMKPEDIHTYFYDPQAQHWTKLERNAIDVGDKLIKSRTNHFTIMIDAVLTVPKNSSPLSFDPTALSSIAAASPAANIDMISPPSANSSGDARLSLPVRLPQGRGAYTPAVSVGYSSGGGNGWAGVGWDVSLSRIEIDTRWGVPDHASDANHRYLLDGAELVRTMETDGPTCSFGSFAGRYHTRIEGAFSHIMRCGSGTTSYHWEVHDRNGTFYLYGSDDATDPNDWETAASHASFGDYQAPKAIVRWNLRRVTDVHGNISDFTYQVDSDPGGPGVEPFREVYPSTIEYTRHTSGKTAAYCVKFGLSDSSRPDAIVSGRNGFKEVTRKLLRSIKVRFGSCDSGEVIRELVLTYHEGQFQKTVLRQAAVYGLGGCNSGGDPGANPFVFASCSGAFFDAHDFDYYTETEGFSDPRTWTVDGDAHANVPVLTESKTGTLSASASYGVTDAITVGANVSRSERKEQVGLYDINGDSLPDMLFDDGTVLYNQSRPDSTTASPLFALAGPAITNGFPAMPRDISWNVGVNAGVKFEIGSHFGGSVSAGFNTAWSRATRLLADANGDGFVDVLYAEDDGRHAQDTADLGGRCGANMCFSTVPMVVPDVLDDPVREEAAQDIAARTFVVDPVVRWVAPFDGDVDLSGTAQKAGAGGLDGVTLELYRNDDKIDELLIAAADTTSQIFPQPQTLHVDAGDALYVRVKTGEDEAIGPNNRLDDLVTTDFHVNYSAVCVGFACGAVPPGVTPRDPSGTPVLQYDSQSDFRLAATVAPFFAPSRGLLELHGDLQKIVSAADIRVCVQRFPSLAESSFSRTFDEPCDAANPIATNLSGTITLAAGSISTQPLDVSFPVELGQAVVLRVESDLSFDPQAIAFSAPTNGDPILSYLQVCPVDDDGNPAPCTSDPDEIAAVPVQTANFGPSVFLVDPDPHVPFVSPQTGFLTIRAPSTSAEPFIYAIRSDRSGIILLRDCRNVSCSILLDETFHVGTDESITVELATESGGSLTGSVLDAYYDADTHVSVPLVVRPLVRAAPPPTPFAGGYRGWSTVTWNENVAFVPSPLLSDYEHLETLTEDRQREIAQTVVPPVPSFHSSFAGGPAWAAALSPAFVSSTGLHAARAGVTIDAGQGNDSGGLMSGHFARQSFTKSYFVGADAGFGGELKGIDVGASLSLQVSQSTTKTTVDIVDLNGDGVLDMIGGRKAWYNLLGSLATLGTFGFPGGFRVRDSHEYSIGFGANAVERKTTPGGRTTGVDAMVKPKGIFGGTGYAIARVQTEEELEDVNGDGLPDKVRRRGNDIFVQLNLGSRYGAEEQVGTLEDPLLQPIDGFQSTVEQVHLPHVYSFSSTDRALQHDTSVTRHHNTGLNVSVPLLGSVSGGRSKVATTTRTTRQIADLNGDGLPDLLVKYDGEDVIHVQYNLGGGHFGHATTWESPGWPNGSLPSPSTYDLNGKLAELGITGPDVLALTSTSDTSYSGSVTILGIGGGAGKSTASDRYEMGLADINGDGSADMVLRYAGTSTNNKVIVKQNRQAGRANLLSTVHQPLGGAIKLDYQRTANTMDMPHSRQVLSKVTVDDNVALASFASPNIVTTFTYQDGVYNRNEKEFFGFSRVTTRRADNVTVEDEYDTSSYTLHGLLKKQTHRDSENRVFSQQVFTREVRAVLDATEQPVIIHAACVANLHVLLAGQGADPCTPRLPLTVRVDELRSEDGSTFKTHVAKDLSHDRFGNTLVSLDEGDEAIADDTVYAGATYEHKIDATHWILGRPTSLIVRAGSLSGTLLRSRSGDYNAFGDPVHINVQTDISPARAATTQLEYDSFGNVVRVTTPPDEAGHPQTVDIAFDAQIATYPTRIQNDFGEFSTATYDLKFGVATLETDVNGTQMRRVLDAQGRLSQVFGPYDTTVPALSMEYSLALPYPRGITTTHTSAPTGYPGPLAPDTRSATFTDGLGRVLEVRKTAVVAGQLGATTSGLAVMDTVGRVVRTQNPFFTAGPVADFVAQTDFGTTTVYDDQDRPILVTYPDNATESASYSIDAAPSGATLFKMRHVEPNGHAREMFADLLGRTRAFVEHPTATSSSVSTYDYLPTGELAGIVDAEGNHSTLQFDLRGLRTSLNNPDTGLIEDRFDLMGNRTISIEPNHRVLGVQVHYVFDRGRLTGIDYPSKQDVTFTYGSPAAASDVLLHQVGRLKLISDESGTRTFEYGLMGETTRTVRTVKPDLNGSQSIVFDLHTASDSLGRLLRVGYPDGVVVTNGFDAAGNLAQVTGAGASWTTNYASGIQYDVFGNRTRLVFGNGVVSSWEFAPERVRLKSVATTLPDSGHTLIQNLSYEYDAASNPKAIVNALATLTGGSGNQPGKSTLQLDYDGVDRLLHVHGQADLSAQKTTTYDELFAYSASHNLLHKERSHIITQPGGIPAAPTDTNFASDYLYDAARPHMPKRVGDLLLTYDASGNPTTRRTQSTGNVQTLVWDDDNRMVDFTSGGVHQHNTFDSTGNRVRRKSTQSETLFSSQYFDLENGTQGVRHVFAGGTRIASVLGKFEGGENPAAPAKTGTPYFFHTDHLGSTSVLTSEDASVYESLEYFPDGEQWIDRAPQKPFNHYLFTGKPFDPDTGFYDFGQRFYEPRTSLWLGIDAAFTDSPAKAVAQPVMLSIGAYAAHRPSMLIDRDGRETDISVETRTCPKSECPNRVTPAAGFGGAVLALGRGLKHLFHRFAAQSDYAADRNAPDGYSPTYVFDDGDTVQPKGDSGRLFLDFTMLMSGGAGRTRAGGALRSGPIVGDVGGVTTRELVAADFGAGAKLETVQGTITVEGNVATVSVKYVEGNMGNPFEAMKALKETARQTGATTLRVEATIANPRLLPVLERLLGPAGPGRVGGPQDVWTIKL